MDCRWILIEFFNDIMLVASFFDHGGTRPFLLLFLSFCFFSSFFFLLGGWAGVSIPLVYMFLDSKALFLLFAFTPHDMTGFFAWLPGCGKEWPDEFMQWGEINVLVGFGRRERVLTLGGWVDKALFVSDKGLASGLYREMNKLTQRI